MNNDNLKNQADQTNIKKHEVDQTDSQNNPQTNIPDNVVNKKHDVPKDNSSDIAGNLSDALPVPRADFPPPAAKRPRRNMIKYWNNFTINSSVDIVDRVQLAAVRSSANGKGIKLTTRKQPGGAIRVWRLS
jgi:hypothetical protein